MKHRWRLSPSRLPLIVAAASLWMAVPGHTHHAEKDKSKSQSANTNSHSDHGGTTGPGQPDPQLMATTATAPAAPTGGALAATIAGDAGGTSSQYAYYADRLANTLAQLTPAQRARVFGGQ